MVSIGVVTGPDLLDAVRASSADHVEPAIVGGLLVQVDASWAVRPAFARGRYPSFALLFPGDVRLSDPEASLDPVRDYLDQALPAVASVAVPGARIVFGSGTARTVPPGVDPTLARRRFAHVVTETRDRAAAHGLRIELEPLRRAETNLLHTVGETVAFLDEHRVHGVGIVADLFHVMAAGEPFAQLARHVDRIGHVHVSDVDRRPIGAHGFPWREFLRTLTDAGYDGAVSLECRWGDDPSGPAPEVERSVRLVRAALP